jgi:hypothetical protein
MSKFCKYYLSIYILTQKILRVEETRNLLVSLEDYMQIEYDSCNSYIIFYSLTEKQSSHGREKFPGRHMSMFLK